VFVKVGINVSGDLQLSRAFLAYDHELEDLSNPLGDVARLVQRTVGEQFDTAGARSGGWQPLDPEYAAWKEEHFPGAGLLVQTGRMKHEALRPGAITVTRDRADYVIDDPKAVWHQEGAGRLPARELVHLLAPDNREAERIFAHWLNDLRHEAFGL
jgi:hypothetical protein